MDNFKTETKETEDNRNVFLMENAMNLMNRKRIKQNSVLRSWTVRSLINRKRKCLINFFGLVMGKEVLEHLVTTGIIEGKHRKENSVKDLG